MIDLIFIAFMTLGGLSVVGLIAYGIWRWHQICVNCGCAMFSHGPSETWCAGCPSKCTHYVHKGDP